MSKKGLSAEEKRTRLLDLFRETQEFYKLPELEKLAPKVKGITGLSVKEVLQELVNDGLVKCEKVGIMKYVSYSSFPDLSCLRADPRLRHISLYWHFPSDALSALSKRRTGLESSVQTLQGKKQIEEEEVRREEEERTGGAHRLARLSALESARDRLGQLEKEEHELAGCDPRLVAIKEEQTKSLRGSAALHTENVLAFLSYIAVTYGAEARDQARDQLGIEDGWGEEDW